MNPFEPLRDPTTGEPYMTLPCMAAPELFDVDAPGGHREAKAMCRDCAAILPCATRARQLGRRAEGVWAGVYHPRSRDGSSALDDPLTAHWAAKVGVTIGVITPAPIPPQEPE